MQQFVKKIADDVIAFTSIMVPTAKVALYGQKMERLDCQFYSVETYGSDTTETISKLAEMLIFEDKGKTEALAFPMYLVQMRLSEYLELKGFERYSKQAAQLIVSLNEILHEAGFTFLNGAGLHHSAKESGIEESFFVQITNPTNMSSFAILIYVDNIISEHSKVH